MIRNITASHYYGQDADSGIFHNPTGAMSYGNLSSDTTANLSMTNNAGANKWVPLILDISRTMLTGNANKPRGWGALACAYLGSPAL